MPVDRLLDVATEDLFRACCGFWNATRMEMKTKATMAMTAALWDLANWIFHSLFNTYGLNVILRSHHHSTISLPGRDYAGVNTHSHSEAVGRWNPLTR